MSKNYFKIISEKATKEDDGLENYIKKMRKEKDELQDKRTKEAEDEKNKNREKVINSIINVPNSKKRTDTNTGLPVVSDPIFGENIIFIPELGRMELKDSTYTFISWTDEFLFRLNSAEGFNMVFSYGESGKLGSEEYEDKFSITGVNDVDKAKLIMSKCVKIMNTYFIRNISNVLLETDMKQMVINTRTMKSNLQSGFLNTSNINPKPRYDIDTIYTNRDTPEKVKFYDAVKKENAYVKSLNNKSRSIMENKKQTIEEKKRLHQENFIMVMQLGVENDKMKGVIEDIFRNNNLESLFENKFEYPFDLVNILNESFVGVIDEVIEAGEEVMEKENIQPPKKSVYGSVEDYMTSKCSQLDKYSTIKKTYEKFHIPYDKIVQIYESVTESKNFEIGQEGGFKVTLNGKPITAASNPDDWKMIQAVRKKYPKEFGAISSKYNDKNIDIAFSNGELTITDDDDKKLLSVKLDDEFTKDELKSFKSVTEGIKKRKFKTGDKVQYKVQDNDNYSDDNGKVIVKPGTYIKGTVKKIIDDDKVTVKWDKSSLGEEDFPSAQLSIKEDKNYPNIEIGGGGTKIGIGSTTDLEGIGDVPHGKELVSMLRKILGPDFIKIAKEINDKFDLIMKLDEDTIEVYADDGKKIKDLTISEYPELEKYFSGIKRESTFKEGRINFEDLKEQIKKYAEKKGLILTDEEKEEMEIDNDDIDIKYMKMEEYIEMKKYARRDLEEEKDFEGNIVKFTIFADNSGNEYIGFTILESIP